jgi:hypothetical protein
MEAGLPDGSISDQESQIGSTVGGLAMENVDISIL